MATKACAIEYSGRGIRVNAVSPGFVEVDSPVNPVTDEYAAAVSVNPTGRTGRPDEIAAAVVWIAGADAGFVTGAVLRVDGGATAGTTALPFHQPAAPHRPTAPSRHYVIVGAGAIGGTLGNHLARAGHGVTVVDADAEHVRHIREHGLTVVRGDERATARVSTAVTPADDEPRSVDRVLLAVKAQATGRALDWIAPRLAADGFVVSLQNGLNEAEIARRIGRERTVGAFVNLFADVVGPGEIRDGGLGALVVGELDGRDSRRVREVVADLQAWGPAKATGNVSGYLWSKLGFGAMLVATALADAPMADLIDRHRTVMHALAAEVYAVAAAEGVVLEPFDAFDPLPYAGSDPAGADAATDALVAWLRTQAKDRSGIWRDIAVRHRPTEVPTHYRPVLATAARHGIPTPGLERLVAQIGELEAGGVADERRIAALAGVLR
jgi:2-dehydropantoate 2-reductase